MDGFRENDGTPTRLDSLFQDQVHASLEQFFEEAQQVHVGVEGLGFESDHKIEVAAGPAFTSSDGAEQAQSSNAKLTQGVAMPASVSKIWSRRLIVEPRIPCQDRSRRRSMLLQGSQTLAFF